MPRQNLSTESKKQVEREISYDPLSPSERSERMKLIRPKNTKVEMVARRLTHAMGYRYRLHSRALPGRPDMVFAARKKVIFVHGCFWHQHENCRQYRMPRSKLDFWLPKLEANKRRDIEVYRRINEAGWRCLIVWECELKNREAVSSKIKNFLE